MTYLPLKTAWPALSPPFPPCSPATLKSGRGLALPNSSRQPGGCFYFHPHLGGGDAFMRRLIAVKPFIFSKATILDDAFMRRLNRVPYGSPRSHTIGRRPAPMGSSGGRWVSPKHPLH